MRRCLIVFSFLTLPLLPLSAQPWLESVPQGERRNFYAVRAAFNEYWETRDRAEKGKGWKPFKRWEWFWEQRVFPSGQFPARTQLYDEYREVVSRRGGSRSAVANWTEIGPETSPGGYSGLGRLNCVRINPLDPTAIWVGAAAGGLWKSMNGGVTWSTTTDELPSLGVTDIAFDPLNPSIIYIATGDGDASDDYSVGVMKSTDAGSTWLATGLSWTTSDGVLLNRIIVKPDDPGILIAAGTGIHRSTDGGSTWEEVMSTRIYDVELKPGSPETMYASGNLGNILRSTDAGVSWTALTNGLPAGGRRVALAVSPSEPDYLYALISNSNSGFLGVYRSTDSGDSWSLRSNSPNLLGWSQSGNDTGGQGWYDLAIAVSPLDPEEVYTGGVNIWKSVNGGSTWSISTMWYAVGGIPNVHADQHDLFFVPGTGTLYAGNDGGIYRTTDGGEDWDWLGEGLRITQFYRFGNSRTDADKILAGAQDNGTKLSNDFSWSDHIGGDGMESLIDYSDPLIMYGTLYYGSIYRTMNGGANWTTISNGISETGGWITPYVIDPVDPQTLYGAYQHVWKTTNRGTTWSIISDFSIGTLSHIAISQSNPSTIYAGNGGFLYRTTDGGATNWTQMTRPPGFGTITDIEVHQTDPNHIWATLSGYFDGQKVSESFDGGLTWTNISGTLPNIPTNCILYQHDSPDRIYVGTDLGVWYRDLTMEDWTEYNDGLANVTVTELEIQYATNKLRAATYGRGVWESDVVMSSSVSCDQVDSFLARCNGSGAVQAMVLIQNSTQFAGEIVSFRVDSTIYPVELMTNGVHSIGRLRVPHAGLGDHTVTLIDPAGCYDPVEVSCSTGRSEAATGFDALWAGAEESSILPGETPIRTGLTGNYPNPFNPNTNIRFGIRDAGFVMLKVYDMLGREVAVLVEQHLPSGLHARQWTADGIAAGVYLVRLQAGSVVETRRIVLLR